MRFRTEIGTVRGSFGISHESRIVMLGSCFADTIGSRLERDGFNVTHNPLGPLFNPASIARIISRGERPYGEEDFICDADGTYHCLDFASRYRAATVCDLARMVNDDYLPLAAALNAATTIIITFGTDKVYVHNGTVAGNCHKLPASQFEEKFLTIDEVRDMWDGLLPASADRILTLSPVRYPGDGLARGFLSKASLRVAVDGICRACGADYFPSYEILNDDLRDYRFYAPDMRHPSDVAADYIYEIFADAYFSNETRTRALECRRQALRAAHRPIL